MKHTVAAAATVLVLSLACGGADVQGVSLTVDGSPWAVDTCTSGAALGFDGVELTGTDGSRLRFATRPDGTADVIYLVAGSTTGPNLGNCAVMAFNQTNLTINDVKALQGGGTVSCSGGDHAVDGLVAVDRCAVPLF